MPTWAIVLILLVARIATAKELPTEIDIRAQYCVPFVQYSLDLVTPLANASVTPPLVEPALLANLQNNRRRLHLYLESRLPHLEPLGMAAARKRGEVDLANFNTYAAETCTTRCQHLFHGGDTQGTATDPWMACIDQCQAAHPASPRLKMCEKLDWLPH